MSDDDDGGGDDGDDGESLIFEDEGTVFLLNDVNRWPNCTASYPRKPEFSQSVSYLECSTPNELAPTDVVLCMRFAPLTHCGPVTQICVFTLQLCKTDDAIHGAFLRMVLLTDVYRN